MNNRCHARLASFCLLLLSLFVILVFRAELLMFSLSGVCIAALLSQLPPKDLFERCAELPVDRAAWKDFFTRYNQDIEAAVRRIIGYPGQGRYCYLFDDIMQRFYQRLLENDRRALRALRGVQEAQAHAYLRTIVAGVAFKMIGSEPQPGVPLDSSEIDNAENPHALPAKAWRDHDSLNEETILLFTSLHEGLMRVLRGRNKYRNMLIFKLVTLDGFSPNEIARRACFGMESRHAVEQLISRTRQKLREFLSK